MSPFHRKALHAAATVALAMGCVKKVESGPDDDLVSTDSGAGDGVDSARPDTGDADSGGPDTGSGADSGRGDSGGSGGDTSGGPGDCLDALRGETADCCAALSEWCAELHGAGTDAYNTCYYGPGFDGSTGCIPWGPPVPPARQAVA